MHNACPMEPGGIAHDASSRRLARTAFVLLFLLMVVNYLDRQVVVAVFVPLEAAWHLSDGQLGLLVSITSIAVALGAVPLSMLADRWSRVRSITLMALVWSLATMAASLAPTYAALLGARALVGLGEASYGAVGVALLAVLYPQERRSSVFGAFFVASILGATLGIALGSVLVQHWGWRFTFVAVGAPGIVLALTFFALLRRHGEADRVSLAGAVATPFPPRTMLAEALRPRTLRWACLGGGFQLLPVAMTYAWFPTFLSREYGLDASAAGIASGAFVLTTGVGVLACGVLADRIARRAPGGRLLVPIVGAILTFLLLTPAFGLLQPGVPQLALFLASALAMMSSVGPVSAVVLDVASPRVRATSAAVLALVQNLFGLAGGPLLAGMLSDRYGLQTALAAVPALSIPAAICFWLARRSYLGDMRRVTAGGKPKGKRFA